MQLLGMIGISAVFLLVGYAAFTMSKSHNRVAKRQHNTIWVR